MKQTRSISKTQRNLSYTPSKSKLPVRNTSQSEFYFCHYKNAMYMGGIKAFQKHGRGVMIHDDGTCAITSYFNDFKNGHNILYKQNCIMSIQYQKNKIIQCALRISCYLLLVRYGKQGKPEGKALLIDYDGRTIYYVVYKKGVVIQKHQQNDSSILNRIFDLQNIQYLIGANHSNAIKFDIQKDQNIASQKTSNKFQAGFYRKGLLSGLGFVLLIRNPNQNGDTHRNSIDIHVKISERGYFLNGSLHGQGQKWFKNGNYYYGDFKQGNFQGKGILKNQIKNNWVFGQFREGNMCELLDYSHEGDLKKLQKLIVSIHQRKNNWINNEIKLQQYEQMIPQIENIITSNPTEKMKNLKDRKQEVLKKIQQNFISQYPDDNQNDEDANVFPSKYPSKDVRSNNYDKKTNDSQTKSYFYSKNNRKQEEKGRQNRNYENRQINIGQYQNSTYRIKLIQPKSSKEMPKNNTYSKQSSKQIAKNNNYNQATSPNSRPKSSSRSNEYYRKNNQNYDGEPTFDEKKFLGRTKIFKRQQISNSQQDQLPKFNYSPFK